MDNGIDEFNFASAGLVQFVEQVFPEPTLEAWAGNPGDLDDAGDRCRPSDSNDLHGASDPWDPGNGGDHREPDDADHPCDPNHPDGPRNTGDAVEFECQQGPKGLNAANVIRSA